MPTQSLQVGVPTAIAQNVVFALPARQCFLESSADLQVSVDFAFATNRAVLATVGGFTGSGFVRCTGVGGATVIAKPT